MTTFNTKRNGTKNYKEIILPPYLKPSELWIAVPRHNYCDRNDNYSSTHQEKLFAGSPIFVSTFQGGLPRADQVSPAAPRVEQQPCLTSSTQNISASATPQGHPGSASASSLSLCAAPCSPTPWAATTVPSHSLYPLTGIPTGLKPRSRM